MATYSIFAPNGELSRVLTIGEGDLSGNMLDGETCIPGVYSLHYVHEGLVLPLPTQPSPHHTFDYTTKQWVDPRTLDDLKATKWEEVKRWRADATVAPQLVTRFGVFDGDAAGVNNIKSAVLGLREAAAIGAAPSTITWTLYDNSAVELTPNELSEVAVMLLARGNVAHVRARVLRLQIEAATTAAELDALAW